MGRILAQEFQIVLGEIGDQQPAAGAHHPSGFRHGGTGIVEIMQHLVEQHRVETAERSARRERQAIGIALPHLTMRQVRPHQSVARDR